MSWNDMSPHRSLVARLVAGPALRVTEPGVVGTSIAASEGPNGRFEAGDSA